jgi:EAL domain-containing protein (putative c-di-GMP-specific phosphodiesterase class I)
VTLPTAVTPSGGSVPQDVVASLTAALQPLVGLDGRVLGFEGLLRGLEAPDDLFRRAVSEGWVEALDRCAAALALHAASRWAGDDEKVFVNAAPMPVSKLADWLQHVIITARRIGIDRSRLVIELNENQTGWDQPELLRCIAGARRLGVSFALDDVDAGPRCARDIELLRPEFVKLDGAVVHAVADPSVRELVSNVVALCDRLGSVLVAEKVETEGQVDALIALGVRHFQGWLTGIPVAGSRPSTRGWSRAA